MELVDGSPLSYSWSGYNNHTKFRIRAEIWDIISQLRQIPRPPELSHLFRCGADGSTGKDVLVRDLTAPVTNILDDESLRNRIYERYLHFNGLCYKDTLPSMLPRSSVSVFTHGDLAPRNIMVKDGCITGTINWEDSGWYPDYLEYANIMKPSVDRDWMAWMDETKPKKWNITSPVTSRAVFILDNLILVRFDTVDLVPTCSH